MSISYCCTIINIEKTTNIKYSILIATLQNNAIKVGMEKSTKNVHEFQRLAFRNKRVLPLQHSFIAFLAICNSFIMPLTIVVPLLHPLQLQFFYCIYHCNLPNSSIHDLSRHKNKISSYYNTEPLNSQIYIDGISCF